jgi:hypothetical protein
MVPKVDPAAAFKSLFSGLPAGGATMSAEAAKALAGARARRKSVLDLLAGNTQRLLTRLGTGDKATMQRYLDELRDFETRVAAAGEVNSSGLCGSLMVPGPIPDAGVGNAGNYSNEDRRAELMVDYVAAALACNRTRVATLQMTWVQCFMSMVPINKLKTDLHEASHAAGTARDVADGIKWHMKHFARLVAKLKDTKEVDGSSLLDNTALVFAFEGGHGFDPDAGMPSSSHSSENMIVLYAGRAGGLKPGKAIAATGKHPAQVMITAMNAVGVPTTKLGDVSGTISEMML